MAAMQQLFRRSIGKYMTYRHLSSGLGVPLAGGRGGTPTALAPQPQTIRRFSTEPPLPESVKGRLCRLVKDERTMSEIVRFFATAVGTYFLAKEWFYEDLDLYDAGHDM